MHVGTHFTSFAQQKIFYSICFFATFTTWKELPCLFFLSILIEKNFLLAKKNIHLNVTEFFSFIFFKAKPYNPFSCSFFEKQLDK